MRIGSTCSLVVGGATASFASLLNGEDGRGAPPRFDSNFSSSPRRSTPFEYMLELEAERMRGGEPERLRLGVGTNGLDMLTLREPGVPGGGVEEEEVEMVKAAVGW